MDTYSAIHSMNRITLSLYNPIINLKCPPNILRWSCDQISVLHRFSWGTLPWFHQPSVTGIQDWFHVACPYFAHSHRLRHKRWGLVSICWSFVALQLILQLSGRRLDLHVTLRKGAHPVKITFFSWTNFRPERSLSSHHFPASFRHLNLRGQEANLWRNKRVMNKITDRGETKMPEMCDSTEPMLLLLFILFF